jgi:hypothetical protein
VPGAAAVQAPAQAMWHRREDVGDGVRVREGDVVGVSEGVDVGEPVMELEPVGESDGLELGVVVTLGVRDRVGVADTVTARTAQHNTTRGGTMG